MPAEHALEELYEARDLLHSAACNVRGRPPPSCELPAYDTAVTAVLEETLSLLNDLNHEQISTEIPHGAEVREALQLAVAIARGG